METPNNLEIKGSLQTNPPGELIGEIGVHKFDGSLRLLHETQKTVVYFDGGKPVFAASNARRHRLFEMLLQSAKITQQQLLGINEFTNDLKLKDNLLTNKLLDQTEIDGIFKRQVNEILANALGWRVGEWIFNPLVRLKNEARYELEINNLLLKSARNFSAEYAAQKFKNADECFGAVTPLPTGVDLSPHEWFIYSRFEDARLRGSDIQNLSGLPETETKRILYNLWLGGFLQRENCHAAFSERYCEMIAVARMTVKKGDPPPIINPPKIKSQLPSVKTVPVEEVVTAAADVSPEKLISLEDYCTRTETAANLYEIFALPPNTTTDEIKKAYFGLAKRFHPDLYRKADDPNLHLKIQHAFTRLAHAYDTLKNESSREIYDFKMRKEIAEMIERQKSGATVEQARVEIELQKQTDQAAESFKAGFDYLTDDEYEAAIPHLARAVFFGKNNALYHAYYGKALSANERQRHRAEAELQTAVKLDSQNAVYRIMLAEFFVGVGLVKRAEGELNRLLTIHPNNHDARILLDSLKQK